MNDWRTRALVALIPLFSALGGWFLSLETRLQSIALTQSERTPRIAKLEEEVEHLRLSTGPTPQAKFVLEDHERRINRMELRINNLHEYLMQLPMRPPPYNGKRGSLDLVQPETP